MEFHQKYELIEPLPGEGPKSFRARQGALGRDVTVHFLLGGQTQENQWLLARLRALPPNSLARIIEVGTNSDGTQYVVTVAPPFQHLMEWLQEQENAAAIEAQSLTRAGMWKVPAMTPPAAAPPVQPAPGTHQPPEPSPVASGPGEFTRMFQAPPAPPAPLATEEITQPIPSPVPPAPLRPIVPPAAPPVAAAPAPPPVAAAQPARPQPGEFTRLFQTPASPAAVPPAPDALATAEIMQPMLSPMPPAPTQRPVAPPGAPAPPAVAASPAPPPAAPQRPASVPTAPPAASQPGEFTRLFQTPAPPAAVPPAPLSLATAEITQPIPSPV
ncbi:MAG: hypothetical protein WB359_20570, partial [Bryobacteraceae bacterium]